MGVGELTERCCGSRRKGGTGNQPVPSGGECGEN